MQASDATLVNLVLDGEEEAYRRLLQRVTQIAFRVALRALNDLDDIDDVVLETLFQAWSHLRELHDPSELEQWVRRIAANCTLRLVRRRQREIHQELDCQVASPDPDPERQAIDSDHKHRILEKMSELPPMERAVAHARYREGMSFREISQALGVDEATARNSVFRAVQKLRAALEPLVRSNHASDK